MNNLATIQTIKNIEPHLNSDNLEIATVLGWKVVVKKREFQVGDLCVYIAIDTVLPDKPEFEFLRNKNFRIKPIRLRGQPSNGICFPLNILPSTFITPLESNDVTDLLGVKHYEKPIPPQLAGNAKGHMPYYLKITDEDNLRTYPHALSELNGHEYYISRKDDGSSSTFYYKEQFGVCSRRLDLEENPNNGFWKMAYKYKIKEALEKFVIDNDVKGVAIQGELVGPGVQKNPLGLSELEFHAFSLFDISTGKYYPYLALKDFCEKFNIPMVTLIEHNKSFNYTLDDLLKIANELKYPNNNPAEGIVIRPTFDFHSFVLNKQWSGKIISEYYNEKN